MEKEVNMNNDEINRRFYRFNDFEETMKNLRQFEEENDNHFVVVKKRKGG